MTRGNQREIDRQRAANRHAGKGVAEEGDPVARRERDALALQAKIAKKKADDEKAAEEEKARLAFLAAAGGAAVAAGGGGVAAGATAAVAEKKKKPKDDMSFLDAALLPSGKKK